MPNPSTENLPILPLRDMVVYPHGVHPLFVGTESSIKALDAAMVDDKQIFLVAKRDPDAASVTAKELFEVGTVSTILQLLKLPDGTVKVLVKVFLKFKNLNKLNKMSNLSITGTLTKKNQIENIENKEGKKLQLVVLR